MEPTREVWDHGLLHLSGVSVREASLLELIALPSGLPADLSISLEQWRPLAASALGLSDAQATACMQLTHLLAPPRGPLQPPLARDEPTGRVALGSLLLVLWVQHAAQQLSHGKHIAGRRAQAATGDVHPSALPGSPSDGSAASPRSLAVQSRLAAAQQADHLPL